MKCPTCASPAPHMHPVGWRSVCRDGFHLRVTGDNTEEFRALVRVARRWKRYYVGAWRSSAEDRTAYGFVIEYQTDDLGEARRALGKHPRCLLRDNCTGKEWKL